MNRVLQFLILVKKSKCAKDALTTANLTFTPSMQHVNVTAGSVITGQATKVKYVQMHAERLSSLNLRL